MEKRKRGKTRGGGQFECYWKNDWDGWIDGFTGVQAILDKEKREKPQAFLSKG